MSAALAAPVIHTGFHRENPRLTVTNESGDLNSNFRRPSKKKYNTRVASLVVRTPDFSISTRVLNGISHTGVPVSGYFAGASGRVAQSVEQMTDNRWVERSNRSAAANEQRYENGISACLRTSGNPGYSRFGLRGGSKPPLCTKIAA